MIWSVAHERIGINWFERVRSSHSRPDHVRVSHVGHPQSDTLIVNRSSILLTHTTCNIVTYLVK